MNSESDRTDKTSAGDSGANNKAGTVLPGGRFAGREAFQQVLRDAFACAVQEGWPEMLLCDASFEDWPLHERAVVESLRAWSKTGRRFTMLAIRFDAVQNRQPRFVTWRKTWDHIIDCRRARADDPLDFPSALWSPGWVTQRTDLTRSIGMSGAEPARRVGLRELLAEKMRGSSPGFPASTLGL